MICQQTEIAPCSLTEERPSFTLAFIEITAGDETTDTSTRSLVELSTVCDSDLLGGSPSPRTVRLRSLDYIHSLLHAAKDNMLAIQPK